MISVLASGGGTDATIDHLSFIVSSFVLSVGELSSMIVVCGGCGSGISISSGSGGLCLILKKSLRSLANEAIQALNLFLFPPPPCNGGGVIVVTAAVVKLAFEKLVDVKDTGVGAWSNDAESKD